MTRLWPAFTQRSPRTRAERGRWLTDARAAGRIAINANWQADDDTRTPAELLDVIEQKGREVAEAVAALRTM